MQVMEHHGVTLRRVGDVVASFNRVRFIRTSFSRSVTQIPTQRSSSVEMRIFFLTTGQRVPNFSGSNFTQALSRAFDGLKFLVGTFRRYLPS